MTKLPILKYAVAGLSLFAVLAAPENAAAQQVSLRYSDNGPPRGPRAEALKWWAGELDKRSGGQIKVKFFWSQSLVKAKENLKAVGSGLAETATIFGVHSPAKFTVWNVGNAPFLFTDTWIGMRTMWEARQTIPELANEAKKTGVKIIFNNTSGPVQLLLAKSSVKSMADLKGLKIRSAGGWTALLTGLGAVPVQIGFGEVYAALDRGTIDGSINYIPLAQAYKHYEVASHLTKVDMGQLLGYGGGINIKIFEAMSKEQQEILTAVSEEYMDVYAKNYINASVKARKEMEAGINGRKIEFYELPAEEREKWEEKAQPFLNDWTKKMKNKGHDGEAILAKIKKIQAKYTAELKAKGYPWTR